MHREAATQMFKIKSILSYSCIFFLVSSSEERHQLNLAKPDCLLSPTAQHYHMKSNSIKWVLIWPFFHCFHSHCCKSGPYHLLPGLRNQRVACLPSLLFQFTLNWLLKYRFNYDISLLNDFFGDSPRTVEYDLNGFHLTLSTCSQPTYQQFPTLCGFLNLKRNVTFSFCSCCSLSGQNNNSSRWYVTCQFTRDFPMHLLWGRQGLFSRV